MRNTVERELGVPAVVADAMPAPASPVSAGGRDEYGVFSNASGSVSYKVHLPPSYRPGRPVPVLLALHGTLMSGYSSNSMEQLSRFSQIADARGFIVVYPTQDQSRNIKGAWNFDMPAHQRRGSGEPSLLAGVTDAVIRKYGADAKRVHVVGASAGAAMAVIMAVTYPDVFAAVGSVAGGEYAADQVVAQGSEHIKPGETAQLAYAQMGSRARQVPAIIIQGEVDPVVPPLYGERLVTHWAAIDDLAVDGRIDGDVDDVLETRQRVVNPGDHPYVKSVYAARESSEPLIEKYLIEGLGHFWSGGSGLFADPLGPDISTIIWDFFATHSLPDRTRQRPDHHATASVPGR
jgi:poly(hydroxyalkanoate) depolymerase family esterase